MTVKEAKASLVSSIKIAVESVRGAFPLLSHEERLEALYTLFEGYCMACGSEHCKNETCRRDE